MSVSSFRIDKIPNKITAEFKGVYINKDGTYPFTIIDSGSGYEREIRWEYGNYPYMDIEVEKELFANHDNTIVDHYYFNATFNKK